jgi:hypothetical protein
MGYQTSSGILKIICDSESVVKIINKMKRTRPTTKFYYSSDADVINEILMAIQIIWKKYGTVTFTHVKGHQDRLGSNLSFEARVNCEADGLATASLRQPNISQLETPNTVAKLTINNKPVTSHHTKTIKQVYHTIALRKYLKESNNWSDYTFESIWWSVYGKCIMTLPNGNQTTMQKLIHKRLPCN